MRRGKNLLIFLEPNQLTSAGPNVPKGHQQLPMPEAPDGSHSEVRCKLCVFIPSAGNRVTLGAADD